MSRRTPGPPLCGFKRRHAEKGGESGVCDPQVFYASKFPNFLARWRVRGGRGRGRWTFPGRGTVPGRCGVGQTRKRVCGEGTRAFASTARAAGAPPEAASIAKTAEDAIKRVAHVTVRRCRCAPTADGAASTGQVKGTLRYNAYIESSIVKKLTGGTRRGRKSGALQETTRVDGLLPEGFPAGRMCRALHPCHARWTRPAS